MAIDATSQLKVGARADIHIDAGLYKGHYPSRLEDIQGELLALSHPFLRGALLPIYKDMQFEVIFEDERSPVAVRASAVRSDLASPAPLLWVRPVGEPIRIQRRRFLRVPCLLKGAFFPLDVEARSPMRGEWRGGGGLRHSLGGGGGRSAPRLGRWFPGRLPSGHERSERLPLWRGMLFPRLACLPAIAWGDIIW